MIDSSALALISGGTSVVTAALGALAAVLTQQRPIEPDDDWSLTWATLPADVRTWVAEQYVAVDLPPPSLNLAIGRCAYAVPSRPSPTAVERR